MRNPQIWTSGLRLDYLQGRVTKEQRDRQKRSSVTARDIQAAHNLFRDTSDEYDVVVGDAPGMISDELRRICRVATHGIIVCRGDKTDQIRAWEEFFGDVGIPVVGVVISKTDGDEGITSHDPLEAVLVDLNRDPRPTRALTKFAELILDGLWV